MTTAAPTVRIVGRYALYGAIASGGMATVFLGRLLGPVGFARTVAVKRLHPQFASDPEFVSMFLDEARLAARIRHPNVVPTLDVVATKGELFLVMEYIHGESLSKLIRAANLQHTPIPVPVAAAILSGVLQGLHAAHEAKSERGVPLQIVHRDVSPQNILVGNDGQARVLDFGVARATGRSANTQDGQLKGKLAYMPPEQLRGELVGPQTDVYAASVVLWEALTAHRLFRAENEAAIINKVLTGSIARPSEGLEHDAGRMQAVSLLDGVVMRGLARDPKDRWPTALEMAHALERAIVPATGAQVSQWVEAAARATLTERASLVAEIESSSAIDAPILNGIPSSGEGPGGPSQRSPSRAGLARPVTDPQSLSATIVDDPNRHSPGGATFAQTLQSEAFDPAEPGPVDPAAPTATADESSYSSAGVAAVSPATRPTALVVVVLGVLGASTLILLLALWIGVHGRTAQPTPGEPVTPASATASPRGVETSPIPATSAAPEPATSAPLVVTTTPEPSVSAPAVPPQQPKRSTRGSGPRVMPKTAGNQAAPSCDPPFTYDANGTKHYKDECF